MKHKLRLLTTLTLSFWLAGCSGPFSDYSDTDLRSEFRKCDYNTLSPAGAQRCLNIEKECKARLEDKGFRC